MRAFFAVPVGTQARAELAQAIASFQAQPWGDLVRWVREDNLHLTLRFLGEIGEEKSDELVERVRGFVGAVEPFSCRLSSVRLFPSESRARVVAAGVAPEPPLSALNELVERGVIEAGLEPDSRRFRSHITLGRARKPPLRGVSLDALLHPAPVEVERVVLYRSRLSSDGSDYTPLCDVPLAGAT